MGAPPQPDWPRAHPKLAALPPKRRRLNSKAASPDAAEYLGDAIADEADESAAEEALEKGGADAGARRSQRLRWLRLQPPARRRGGGGAASLLEADLDMELPEAIRFGSGAFAELGPPSTFDEVDTVSGGVHRNQRGTVAGAAATSHGPPPSPLLPASLRRPVVQLNRVDAALVEAAAWLSSADAVVFLNGQEEWSGLQAVGLTADQLRDEKWFDENPRLAWAFWAHEIQGAGWPAAEASEPAIGAIGQQWNRLGDPAPLGCFVLSTFGSRDQWLDRGCLASRLLSRASTKGDPSGSFKMSLKCVHCSFHWDNSADEIVREVDEDPISHHARGSMPTCARCNRVARPSLQSWPPEGSIFYEDDVQLPLVWHPMTSGLDSFGAWVEDLCRRKYPQVVFISIGDADAQLKHVHSVMARRIRGVRSISVRLRGPSLAEHASETTASEQPSVIVPAMGALEAAAAACARARKPAGLLIEARLGEAMEALSDLTREVALCAFVIVDSELRATEVRAPVTANTWYLLHVLEMRGIEMAWDMQSADPFRVDFLARGQTSLAVPLSAPAPSACIFWQDAPSQDTRLEAVALLRVASMRFTIGVDYPCPRLAFSISRCMDVLAMLKRIVGDPVKNESRVSCMKRALEGVLKVFPDFGMHHDERGLLSLEARISVYGRVDPELQELVDAVLQSSMISWFHDLPRYLPENDSDARDGIASDRRAFQQLKSTLSRLHLDSAKFLDVEQAGEENVPPTPLAFPLADVFPPSPMPTPPPASPALGPSTAYRRRSERIARRGAATTA